MTQLTYTIILMPCGIEVKNSSDYKITISPCMNKLIEICTLECNGFMHDIRVIEKNPNHPLSELANKLGATVYGGFADERDFHLLLPTIKGKKSGDVLYSENDSYKKLIYWNENVGTLCINRECHCDEDDILTYFLRNRELDDSDTLEGNIFEEYARTGVIENDLYKQFFKI